MLKNKINALFNPEQFHGWGKDSSFFEGWYFKVISNDEKHAFAIIPGIAMDQNGQKQAFVQVLDGKQCTAVYHKFEANAFVPQPNRFKVEVGDNIFWNQGLEVNLPNFKGKLTFSSSFPWPSHWYSPGIMGPFSFVPFMECYHGILSMDHTIKGELTVEGKKIDFNNGRGYLEKDWGKSFPSAYIWMQCNHFSKPGISLKTSVAKIPWLGTAFVGFIGGLLINGKLYQFTTYNLTKLKQVAVSKDAVKITLQNASYKLEIVAHRALGTALASPIGGLMDGRIEESMTARVEVKLFDQKKKQLIFNDLGRNTGLEVAGKIEEILVVEKTL